MPENEILSAPTGLVAVVIDNIKTIRKAHRWTQEDLAERCDGFDRGTVSKIENGLRGIGVPDLEILGAAFHVDPSRLLKPLVVSVVVADIQESDDA